jgi:hypothetical protein
LSGHSSENEESHRFVVMEILVSREEPDQDQEQWDLKEKLLELSIENCLISWISIHRNKG